MTMQDVINAIISTGAQWFIAYLAFLTIVSYAWRSVQLD